MATTIASGASPFSSTATSSTESNPHPFPFLRVIDSGIGYEFQMRCEVPLQDTAEADAILKDLIEHTSESLTRARLRVLQRIDPSKTPVFRDIVWRAFEDNMYPGRSIAPRGIRIPNLRVTFDTGDPRSDEHAERIDLSTRDGHHEFVVQCEVRITERKIAEVIRADVEARTPDSLARAMGPVLDRIDRQATDAFKYIVRSAFQDNIDPGKPLGDPQADDPRMPILAPRDSGVLLIGAAASKTGETFKEVARELRDGGGPPRTVPLFFPNGIELIDFAVVVGLQPSDPNVRVSFKAAGKDGVKAATEHNGDGGPRVQSPVVQSQ
jgi:hypothetical protein